MKPTIMKSQHGFQLTLQTIIILVILLISLVLILFFFTSVFSDAGVQIAEQVGALKTPSGELTGEGEDSLRQMPRWANPFEGEGEGIPED